MISTSRKEKKKLIALAHKLTACTNSGYMIQVAILMPRILTWYNFSFLHRNRGPNRQPYCGLPGSVIFRVPTLTVNCLVSCDFRNFFCASSSVAVACISGVSKNDGKGVYANSSQITYQLTVSSDVACGCR